MADTTNMRLVIDADTDGAVRGVKSVDRAISGLDDTHVRAGASARKFGAMAAVGIGAAGVAAFAFGKSSVKAFMDAQASMAVTEASLDRNNKGWRTHKGEIDRAIKSHMDLSGFDDEDLYRSFSNLSRVTGDTSKGLKAQTTVMDLARARGISLEQATNLVSKAYLGNTTSLKRLGIELPKGAKGMEVLDALNKKFAGSAKAYGDTTAGQAERMGVAWENLKEDVGQALIPLVNGVLQGSLAVVTWAQQHWPQFKQVVGDAFRSAQMYAQQAMAWFRANVLPTIQAIVTGAKAFWAMFGDDITRVFEFITRQVQRALIVLRSVIQIVLALIRGDWSAAWNGLKTLVSTIFAGIVDTIRTLATTMLSVAAKVGTGIVTGIINGLKALGGKVSAEMGKAVSAVRSAAAAALSAAAAVGRAIVTGVFNGIKGLAALGGRIMSSVVGAIGSVLVTAYSMATGIGSAIANGVVAGLGGLASALGSALASAATSAFEYAKNKLGIGSPSRVAAKELGEPIVQGVAMGITEQARKGGMKVALTAAVKEALSAAKEKAMSAASDLASSIARVIDETTRRALGALDNSPEAQRIRAIEQAQRTSQRVGEKAQLQTALDQAQTPAERQAAQKAMDEWLLEQERQTLQDSLDQRRAAIQDEAEARKTAAADGLQNLQAMLANGLISQATYNAQVKALLAATAPDYRAVGESLGYAFATGFAAQIAAVLGWNPGAIQQAATNAAFAKAMGGPDKLPKSLLASLPKHAAGIDYVPRTGPAVIHAGETVLNPQRAAEYRAGRMGGNVSITFADGMGWLAQFVKVKVDAMSEATRRSSLAAGAVR